MGGGRIGTDTGCAWCRRLERKNGLMWRHTHYGSNMACSIWSMLLCFALPVCPLWLVLCGMCDVSWPGPCCVLSGYLVRMYVLVCSLCVCIDISCYVWCVCSKPIVLSTRRHPVVRDLHCVVSMYIYFEVYILYIYNIYIYIRRQGRLRAAISTA